MNITRAWLEEHGACHEGKEWFLEQGKLDLVEGSLNLVKENKLDWANWLITRAMSHKQQVRYAIFAAKQVLKRFEAKYPKDKRPREAIKAAEKFLRTGETAGLNAAADAAYAAAYAAEAANAADAAGYGAYAAANAAANAANAADAAGYVAADAAGYVAANAAYVTRDKMKRKIVLYGIKLLKKGE